MPTDRGMRLYEEVDRIFAGVNQIARAIESIRREEHDRLLIGVMPGLAGSFISRAVVAFLTPSRLISIFADRRNSSPTG